MNRGRCEKRGRGGLGSIGNLACAHLIWIERCCKTPTQNRRAEARLPMLPRANLYRIEDCFSFVFSRALIRMMILWGLFVSNRNGAVLRGSRLARCGAGAKLAEKLAIRKYFLVCCEEVSSISNI